MVTKYYRPSDDDSDNEDEKQISEIKESSLVNKDSVLSNNSEKKEPSSLKNSEQPKIWFSKVYCFGLSFWQHKIVIVSLVSFAVGIYSRGGVNRVIPFVNSLVVTTASFIHNQSPLKEKSFFLNTPKKAGSLNLDSDSSKEMILLKDQKNPIMDIKNSSIIRSGSTNESLYTKKPHFQIELTTFIGFEVVKINRAVPVRQFDAIVDNEDVLNNVSINSRNKLILAVYALQALANSLVQVNKNVVLRPKLMLGININYLIK